MLKGVQCQYIQSSDIYEHDTTPRNEITAQVEFYMYNSILVNMLRGQASESTAFRIRFLPRSCLPYYM